MRWTELGSDVKVTMRSLARSPLFTVAAVLSLALGMGGVATVYGLADRLLLRPIDGVRDPDRLVEVVPGTMSYPGYSELAESLSTLEGLAAHRVRTVSLEPGAGGEPRPVGAGIVSGNYFELLGISPVAGRLLGPGDNVRGAPLAAVLSYGLWTELGRSPDVLGTTLRINGTTFNVVGVAPAEFDGLRIGMEPAFWMAIEAWPSASLGRTPDVSSPGWGWLSAVGRLRTGVSRAAATEDLRAVNARLDALRAGSPSDVAVVPARTRVAESFGGVLRPLLIALGAVLGLALLAAAANLANLLLGRATRRTRELGIRAALGADRVRLARLLAIETGLLAMAGLAGGLLMSALLLRAISALELPGGLVVSGVELRADGRLFLLAAVTLALIAAIVGLGPALFAARTRPAGLGTARTAGEGARTMRLRSAFTTLQIGVAVLLLAGTALFGSSIARALRVDLGFEPAGLAVARIDGSLFEADRDAAADAIDRLVHSVRDLPGIEAAAWTTTSPLTSDSDHESFTIVGRPVPETRPVVEVHAVGPQYFRAAGIAIVRGNAAALDGPVDVPIGVITEAMARQYWPDSDPIGAEIEIMDQRLAIGAVAADTRLHGFDSQPGPVVFAVVPAVVSTSVALVMRGPQAAAVLRSATVTARSIDPRLVLTTGDTGAGLVRSLLLPQRLGGLVLLVCALLAIGLALTGVYGVVAYGVGARVREFGVRLTLGARPAQVTLEVLGRSVVPIAAGILLGTLASLALTRAVSPILFGVEPDEFAAPLLAAALVLAMALFATWLPARRAGHVEPATVLGAE
jgi:putative ABC transport system permease protein